MTLSAAAARASANPLASYQADAGNDVWLTRAVIFCAIPDRTAEKSCEFVSGHVHFRILGAQAGARGEPYYQTALDDGRHGFVLASELMDSSSPTDIVAAQEKAAADCRKRGPPRIGMSAQQVAKSCWGKPDHVNRSETATAIFDQYVYEDGRYVYLRNGVVTSIQTSGTLR
jgi:hypothetical protein